MDATCILEKLKKIRNRLSFAILKNRLVQTAVPRTPCKVQRSQHNVYEHVPHIEQTCKQAELRGPRRRGRKKTHLCNKTSKTTRSSPS